MLSEIKWGFIGCGSVVETKSGMAFNNVKNSSVHAIMRRDLRKSKASAQKLNAKCAYDNVTDLLNNEDVNAIYIATPPGLHYEQAMACARAGKPTYIEKPFARSFSESREIVKCFEMNAVPLFIGHYRRALPKFRKLKELIDKKVIGEVCEADFRLERVYSENDVNKWLYNPIMSGGGKFFDIAPHTIDILVYLFGDFKTVTGLAVNNNKAYMVEDVVTMNFQTYTDVIGTANFNTISNKKRDEMLITGSKGQIIFSIHGSNDITIKTDKGTEYLTFETPQLIEEPMIRNVVEALRGNEKPLCSGGDALETTRVIDIILDKYYGGRSDDFWNRPNSWNQQ